MSATPLPHDIDEHFREVSGRTYVLTLLQSLIRRRVLVSIYLPDSDVQYTSTVLSIDPQTGTFLLDELYPLSGHPKLEASGKLRLFAQLDGAALGFDATLQAVEHQEGLYYFSLLLPDKVSYLQRRDDHRVVVSRLAIHAELYDHNGKVHKVILNDISTGGINLVLPQGEEQAFHQNGVYSCILHLPGEEPFHCDIDICYKHQQGNDLIIGGSYVGLDTRSEHALRRVVVELERRLLRLRWEPTTPPQTKSESK